MAADGFIISFTRPELDALPTAFLHFFIPFRLPRTALSPTLGLAFSTYHLDLAFKLIVSTIEGKDSFLETLAIEANSNRIMADGAIL